MSDDLRQRYAEAVARWAQMYPIPAWGLARDDAAENLAQRWGEVAATFTLAVRDEEMERLRELVRDLTDDDPCWFDHHGYCQAHGWLDTEPRCPHGRAQALLATLDSPDVTL